MAKQQKKNYRDEYLEDFKMITGITDLTLQDVYGAMMVMFKKHQLKEVGRSAWSKYQFDILFKTIMNADDFGTGMSNFKDAIAQTRFDRTHRISKAEQQKRDEKLLAHYYDDVETNPEEDMESMSDELLRQDDVYYTNESLLFSKWKSLNEAKAINSALNMRVVNSEYIGPINQDMKYSRVYWLSTKSDNPQVIGCKFTIPTRSKYPYTVTIVMKSNNTSEYIDISDDSNSRYNNIISEYMKNTFNYEISL